MSELSVRQYLHNDGSGLTWGYDKREADKYIKELKDEIDSLKIKFREFNNNVCKKVCEASRAMSAISQDAQMDFYEEFINEAK